MISRKALFAQHMVEHPTIYERHLWRRLRKGYKGLLFEPQAVIEGYIVDFYCEQAKLAIELDGKGHDPVKDSYRDAQISKVGVNVLRFPNPTDQVEVNAILFRVCAECRYREKERNPHFHRLHKAQDRS